MDLARTDFDARRDRQLDVDVGQRFRHLWIHRAAVRMAFSLSGCAMSTSIKVISDPNSPNPDHTQHREHSV
jgi:hypothetical protein